MSIITSVQVARLAGELVEAHHAHAAASAAREEDAAQRYAEASQMWVVVVNVGVNEREDCEVGCRCQSIVTLCSSTPASPTH